MTEPGRPGTSVIVRIAIILAVVAGEKRGQVRVVELSMVRRVLEGAPLESRHGRMIILVRTAD
jgi:hypothetical protein